MKEQETVKSMEKNPNCGPRFNSHGQYRIQEKDNNERSQYQNGQQ